MALQFLNNGYFAGNVGIGTISPRGKLDVVGNTDTDSDFLTIQDDDTSAGSHRPSIRFRSNTAQIGQIMGLDGSMRFSSGASESSMIEILDNGKVGIGTDSPDALLHVRAATNVTGTIEVQGGKATVTSAGEINAELNFGSNDGSATGGIGGSIKSVTENTNGAYVGMSFYTAKQGRTPVLKEAMRIDKDGFVGIGTNTPGEKLDVNGRVRIGDINYAYGGSNYHILLAEDSNDAYISNINGYGILSAGGYYYGANLRKLNSTSTAYSGIQTRPDGTIIFESATGGTAGDTITATEKMRISSNGSVQLAAYNSSNNIGTATYLLGTDVSGNVVKTSAAPSANFNQGAKTHTVGTAFSNVLTVALSSHQGCYVTLCCFGDWGGHSSAAYRGEFFLQNGAGIYNEPGIIIRQDDNTSDGTDQIICQILDPGGSTGSRNFIIQIRHTDTTSPANFTGTITFTVQGQFNSVT